MSDSAPVTLKGVLESVKSELAASGIADAALEARIIVEHFSGTTRGDALSTPLRVLDAHCVSEISDAVARRRNREPVHRILGYREFHGLPLKLSRGTLEPRPDTETLVDAILPFVEKTAKAESVCRILDLGTGTGAIALALLNEAPLATAVGADISADALATASANAAHTGLDNRFATLESDWFSDVSGRFHVIVSNPPYIATGDLGMLQPEVRLHDPVEALDGGFDGLDAYRVLAANAQHHLEEDGRVAVEIGYLQKQDVVLIFRARGYRVVDAMRDLGGNDRVLIFRR